MPSTVPYESNQRPPIAVCGMKLAGLSDVVGPHPTKTFATGGIYNYI
jgi:hypothetical protein